MTFIDLKTRTKATLVKLYKDEEGSELLEYALIAGLIVIAAIAAIKLFSTTLQSKFEDVSPSIDTAGE